MTNSNRLEIATGTLSLAKASDQELVKELCDRYHHCVCILQSRKNNLQQGLNAASGDFRICIPHFEQIKWTFFSNLKTL